MAFFYAGTLIISLTTFRPVGSFFNGSDTFYLVAAVLLVIRLLHEGNSPIQIFIRDNPFFKPLVIFLFSATLSLVNSSDITTAATVMGKYLFLLVVWLPMGMHLLNTPERIRWMLFVLGAATLVALIPAVSDYYFQTRTTLVIDRLLHMNLEYTVPISGRFGSVMGHPNNFGFMLVVVFPISLGVIYFSASSAVKSFGLLFLCMLLMGSLVTASRSMTVAMLIQTICFVALAPQSTFKKKIIYLLLLLMVSGAIIGICVKSKPTLIVERFMEMASHDLGEYEPDSTRVEYIIEAWQAIRTHPIAGLGVENTSASEDAIGVHNTILRLWSGIGIGGLVFICWIYFLAFFRACLNLKKSADVKNHYYLSISFILLVSLIGWFLVDMVQPQFYDRYKFVILILLFSLSGVIETDAAKSVCSEKKPAQ
jgi:O-antigen ligase